MSVLTLIIICVFVISNSKKQREYDAVKDKMDYDIYNQYKSEKWMKQNPEYKRINHELVNTITGKTYWEQLESDYNTTIPKWRRE